MKAKKSKNTPPTTLQQQGTPEQQQVMQSPQPATPTSNTPSDKRPKPGEVKKKASATGAQAKAAKPQTKSPQTRSTIANKQICNLVYDVFPELDVLWAVNPTKDNPKFKQKLDDISVVLKYFATHPRILESIKTGMLS